MAAMNGTIKRIVSDKGFGFILGSDGNEYFFHNSACRDTRFDALREGQAVTFERDKSQGSTGENVGSPSLALVDRERRSGLDAILCAVCSCCIAAVGRPSWSRSLPRP